MKIRLFLLGVVASAFAACAETIFIETESFKDYGGWVNDTQFMDQMGERHPVHGPDGLAFFACTRDGQTR